MTLANWFIHLHDALHWWGPFVLALYISLLLWVLHYICRYYEEVNYNPNSKFDHTESMSTYWQIFWFLLPTFYVWWFALPYKGTEILLDIVGFLVSGIYVIYPLVFWVFVLFCDILCDSGLNSDKRKKTGMSLADWEIFQYKEERKEEAVRLRAFEEREAILAKGVDIRKNRFHIIDGVKRGGRR